MNLTERRKSPLMPTGRTVCGRRNEALLPSEYRRDSLVELEIIIGDDEGYVCPLAHTIQPAQEGDIHLVREVKFAGEEMYQRGETQAGGTRGPPLRRSRLGIVRRANPIRERAASG